MPSRSTSRPTERCVEAAAVNKRGIDQDAAILCVWPACLYSLTLKSVPVSGPTCPQTISLTLSAAQQHSRYHTIIHSRYHTIILLPVQHYTRELVYSIIGGQEYSYLHSKWKGSERRKSVSYATGSEACGEAQPWPRASFLNARSRDVVATSPVYCPVPVRLSCDTSTTQLTSSTCFNLEHKSTAGRAGLFVNT